MKLIRTVSELVVGDSFKDIRDSDDSRYAKVLGLRSGRNPVSKKHNVVIKVECTNYRNEHYQTWIALMGSDKVWMKKR